MDGNAQVYHARASEIHAGSVSRRAMLFGAMLVEWQCSKCNWLDFVDIENGTDYPQLEEIVKQPAQQHQAAVPIRA